MVSLLDWASKHHTVAGFPGGEAFESSEIITWPCDVLIPAALEEAITKDNARDVRASMIIEGANGPTTPEANDILLERGVTIVPDLLANAGGVTASYFEWAQNIQQFRWDLETVISRLEQTMVRAYAEVRDLAKQKSTDLRTASFVLGIQRVGKAATSRHHIREKLDFD